MTDNATLRDHRANVVDERNELLRRVMQLEALLYKKGLELGFMERRLEELTRQLAALWKVDNE